MEVVLAFLSGQDILVSVPTGEGKLLCNAVLPWTGKEGSTVVVVSRSFNHFNERTGVQMPE